MTTQNYHACMRPWGRKFTQKVAATMHHSTHRIAVLAGDGIGNEVMPEGLRVVEAAARKFGIGLEFTTFDWAHCGYYRQHGQIDRKSVV